MGLYNLQGTIGLKLEQIAREELEVEELLDVQNSFFSASSISAGAFVEVMLFLLRNRHGFEESFIDFARECQPLLGKALTQKDKELATSLLARFETELNKEKGEHR